MQAASPAPRLACLTHPLLVSSYKATDESTQGSHSTEENVLTVRDLKNIFVDGDD